MVSSCIVFKQIVNLDLMILLLRTLTLLTAQNLPFAIDAHLNHVHL